jgi:hypothetical protein
LAKLGILAVIASRSEIPAKTIMDAKSIQSRTVGAVDWLWGANGDCSLGGPLAGKIVTYRVEIVSF